MLRAPFTKLEIIGENASMFCFKIYVKTCKDSCKKISVFRLSTVLFLHKNVLFQSIYFIQFIFNTSNGMVLSVFHSSIFKIDTKHSSNILALPFSSNVNSFSSIEDILSKFLDLLDKNLKNVY